MILKYNLFFLLFIACVSISAQTSNQIAVVTSSGTKYIPAYERQGINYFSLIHYAEASATNYYYNSEAGKVELKFTDFNLKVTAKNPYLVLTSRKDNKSEIAQLPTSTYLIDNHIYIPLLYSIDILSKASANKIRFELPGKIILTDDLPVEEPVKVKTEFALTGLNIDEKINGTLIRVKSKKRIATYSSSYKDNVLTIIFRDVNADVEKFNYTGKGLIKEVKGQNVGQDTEIKFTLGNEYTTNEVLNADGSNDILITIHNKIFSRNIDKNRSKWEFDVIVIDAGHGGKDAGAIGVNGVKEKDVNLGIALKLGKLIEQNMKDVKVVYTRKDDRFVELYKRGKIANEQGGKLFISIHCNSVASKSSNASGFEVYLLRPGRTQEAISIAERENSVIQYEENPERYQKLTDENFILVTMAHSAYMKYSEKFSDILNKQMGVDLSIPSRGIKQAGFYVLVGASMPSVLIETGFLSNKKDADYLKSTKGQNDIAGAIFKSVKSFREYYEKVMQTEL